MEGDHSKEFEGGPLLLSPPFQMGALLALSLYQFWDAPFLPDLTTFSWGKVQEVEKEGAKPIFPCLKMDPALLFSQLESLLVRPKILRAPILGPFWVIQT